MAKLGTIIDSIIDLCNDIDPYLGIPYEEGFYSVAKQIYDDGYEETFSSLEAYVIESSEDSRDEDVRRWYDQLKTIRDMMSPYID